MAGRTAMYCCRPPAAMPHCPEWGSLAACCSIQDTLPAASISFPKLCKPPLGSVRTLSHANSGSASLALQHIPCSCCWLLWGHRRVYQLEFLCGTPHYKALCTCSMLCSRPSCFA